MKGRKYPAGGLHSAAEREEFLYRHLPPGARQLPQLDQIPWDEINYEDIQFLEVAESGAMGGGWAMALVWPKGENWPRKGSLNLDADHGWESLEQVVPILRGDDRYDILCNGAPEKGWSTISLSYGYFLLFRKELEPQFLKLMAPFQTRQAMTFRCGPTAAWSKAALYLLDKVGPPEHRSI